MSLVKALGTSSLQSSPRICAFTKRAVGHAGKGVCFRCRWFQLISHPVISVPRVTTRTNQKFEAPSFVSWSCCSIKFAIPRVSLSKEQQGTAGMPDIPPRSPLRHMLASLVLGYVPLAVAGCNDTCRMEDRGVVRCKGNL